MADRNLFTDYLDILGVPHTARYSRRRFVSYPHKMALTAVGDLLAEYGVLPHDIPACDAPDLSKLDTPAVAALKDGSYCIVTGVGDGKVRLKMRDGSRPERPAADFVGDWTGAAVWGTPQEGAEEPHLGRHRFEETMCVAQKIVFWVGLAFIAVFLFISHGVYLSWGQTTLCALYGAGIYISYLLILKDNGVHSGAADRMCGIIQRHGCGTVLADSSSKLFGLYPWCEIGLTYFSVSLAALLLFPGCARWLAAFSVCCLPYTVWSVTYQKFKIHAWCTLCLTVQTLMWVIFIVMLLSGQFHYLLPVPLYAVALVLTYIVTFLGLHRLVGQLNFYEKPEG